MSFGATIKEARKKEGLSQLNVAKALSIDQSYLSRLEKDQAIPSANLLKAFSKYYSISEEKLIASFAVQTPTNAKDETTDTNAVDPGSRTTTNNILDMLTALKNNRIVAYLGWVIIITVGISLYNNVLFFGLGIYYAIEMKLNKFIILLNVLLFSFFLIQAIDMIYPIIPDNSGYTKVG